HHDARDARGVVLGRGRIWRRLDRLRVVEALASRAPRQPVRGAARRSPSSGDRRERTSPRPGHRGAAFAAVERLGVHHLEQDRRAVRVGARSGTLIPTTASRAPRPEAGPRAERYRAHRRRGFPRQFSRRARRRTVTLVIRMMARGGGSAYTEAPTVKRG